MFETFTNEFKTNFENRKWTYPKRKLNHFFYLFTSIQKNFFYHVLIRRASLTTMFQSSFFLFDFFNLNSSLYSCPISFLSGQWGSSLTSPCKSQVDFLMASGCFLIIISPNSLRWSSNHLLISNKILSQGLKVFWLLYFQISPQNLPYWNTRKAYLRGELFDKGGGVILHGVPYGINVLLKWSWFLLALEVFQCEHYLSP